MKDQKKLNSYQVLEVLINLLLDYLEELKDYRNVEGERFQYGERVAYTECLEYIQMWEYAEEFGLDFDIEEKYPV